MVLLDYLCCRVRGVIIVEKLHAVIYSLESFIDRKVWVDWLDHSLIVIFNIRGRDISISIKKILDKILAHDSEESRVTILQNLDVCVFDGVYDLVIGGFIHCARILVDYPDFVVLEL